MAGGRVLVHERRETVGIGDAADVCQQLRGALPQQPSVSGAYDLSAQQRDHAAAQIGAVVLACPLVLGEPLHRQPRPLSAGVLGSAGHPALLPGAAGLVFQPVQQLDEAALP
ncbi:hypothetical protein AB4Z54_22570 [Streptomyces sp. MCAF7]